MSREKNVNMIKTMFMFTAAVS